MSMGREYLADHAYEIEEAKKEKQKPMFTRGYALARDKVESGGRFMRVCQNCAYYGRDEKSKGDECLNNAVTKYDLIFDKGNVSCTQWTSYTHRLKNQVFGRKTSGRDMFDRLIGE